MNRDQDYQVENGLGYFDSEEEVGSLVRNQVQTIVEGSGSTRPSSDYDPAPDVDYLQVFTFHFTHATFIHFYPNLFATLTITILF